MKVSDKRHISSNEPYVKIRCESWTKDSYGLFDYQFYDPTTSFVFAKKSFHLNSDNDGYLFPIKDKPEGGTSKLNLAQCK